MRDTETTTVRRQLQRLTGTELSSGHSDTDATDRIAAANLASNGHRVEQRPQRYREPGLRSVSERFSKYQPTAVERLAALPVERSQADDTLVVFAEKFNEFAFENGQSNRLCVDHLFNVLPIFAPIKERFEHGKVDASQKRHRATCEFTQDDSICDRFVEGIRSQENVEWDAVPPEPCLTVSLKLRQRPRRRFDL